MNNSPLNDAIRDVLADFSGNDRATSCREVAEEVMTRRPKLVKERGAELVLAELVNRVRTLRKKPPKNVGRSSAQLVIPAMAKDLLPRLPAEIPRWPEQLAPIVEALEEVPEDHRHLYEPSDDGGYQLREDAIEQDEIPWGNLWTSTLAEVRRHCLKLAAGIRADQRRLQAIRELLDMAKGAGDDARLIDAVRRVPEPVK